MAAAAAAAAAAAVIIFRKEKLDVVNVMVVQQKIVGSVNIAWINQNGVETTRCENHVN